MIKGKYMRKRKDAERRGDEAYTTKVSHGDRVSFMLNLVLYELAIYTF